MPFIGAPSPKDLEIYETLETISDRKTYTGDGSKRVFGVSYFDNHISVFQNGLKLVEGIDYNLASSGQYITFTIAPENGDLIDLIGTVGVTNLSQSSYIRETFVSVANQTSITLSTDIDPLKKLNVYYNGIRLSETDYTIVYANNTVSFSQPALADDLIAIDIFAAGYRIIDSGTLSSNHNLIINGDFRVNQRGAASRTATPNAYNYDRWYYDGTYLYQGVEDKSVANGAYTLTWVDAGSDITAAYIVSTDSSNNNGPDSGLTYTAVSNGGNITVSEGTEYSKHLWIRFGGTLANLSKVQLVYGSVATPFEHRSYGEELALCQRYFYHFSPSTNMPFFQYQANFRAIMMNFPVTMRTSPTLAIDGYFNETGIDGSSTSPTSAYAWRRIVHTDTTSRGITGATLDAEL